MRRHKRRLRRGLPLDRTMRPDTVLLRRELRWIAAAMAGLGATGYAFGGPYGAAIGCGAGFLLQQACYRVAVRRLWRGWVDRALAYESAEEAEDPAWIWRRAFALWMRTASPRELHYIAGWHDDEEEAEDDQQVDTGWKLDAELAAEMRIWDAYEEVTRLEDEPLWCDNVKRRRLRHSLQRDERRLLSIATGEDLER